MIMLIVNIHTVNRPSVILSSFVSIPGACKSNDVRSVAHEDNF